MRLLIIGNINPHVSLAYRIARQKGADVAIVDTIVRAIDHIRAHGTDLALIDACLDIGMFCQALKRERIATPIMAFSTVHDPILATNAIRAGAQDYLPFPPDPELIGSIIATISQHRIPIIARDKRMLKVIADAERIASSDASVLITGESGTGKEVISKLIHERSNRSTKPFISINCAAIPENLLESELFGHERGAFTGAVARRIGKFEEAQGGTLLLDEISEMSLPLQAKLLRAIQERTIERLGSNKSIGIDIRILATSNRDLQESIKKKDFREDLFYRLNVVSVHLPSLRERPDDIAALATYFCEKYCKINGIPKKTMSDHVVTQLCSYGWPGNVRELENIIHRSVLMSDDAELSVEDLPSRPSTSKPGEMNSLRHVSEVATQFTNELVGKTIEEVEQALIVSTLKSCDGNRTHAARILGISIRTLRNKLNFYVETGRLDRSEFSAV